MCGGSPLIVFFLFVVLLVLFHVGEIHRSELYFYYSRSPLSEPVESTVSVCNSDVGEITQGRYVIL